MRFERTADMELVRSIVSRPEVYRWVSDDFSVPAEDFRPIAHPSIWYVLAFDKEELLGLWSFIPQNSICWDVHTTLLPEALLIPGRSVEAGKQMAQWIWENTICRRIVTAVPHFNRLALRFAKKVGMMEFGVNQSSFQKGGILYDQILLGLSRPEVI